MRPLRILLLTLLACCCLLTFAAFTYWYTPGGSKTKKIPPSTSAVFIKMQQKAALAKKFVSGRNFNKQICFLIDMNISSGSNRFFIYDMMRDSILNAALVTHGRCNEDWLTGRKYSNKPGSGCTSPGKYKIGHAYQGSFGLAYKLYGLDSTNSNAYKRYVVLHSHECVPEREVDPMPICQSDGCPTVSTNFLKTLSAFIDKSEKPILLWIYP